MDEACAATTGAMAAMIGAAENAVRQLADDQDVDIANINSPGQIVISGELAKVEAAVGLAKEHGIPFYVAAPWSTVDMKMSTGENIPIEQRSPREVTHHAGKQVAPDGVLVENPAFDVTPHKYIAAIITERGIAKPNFAESLQELAQALPAMAEARR